MDNNNMSELIGEKIIVNLETVINEIVKCNAMHVSEFLNVMIDDCPILYLGRDCPKNSKHKSDGEYYQCCYMCWVEYLLLEDERVEDILRVLK